MKLKQSDSKEFYVVIYAISYCLFLCFNLNSPIHPSAIAILSLGAAATVLSLYITCASRTSRPVLYFTNIYFLFFFYIPAMYHLAGNRFPWPISSVQSSDLIIAAAVTSIFSVLFNIAALTNLKPVRIERPSLKGATIDYDNIPIYIVASLLTSLLFSMYVGFDVLTATRRDVFEGTFEASPINVISLAAARAFSYLGALFAVILVRRKANFLTVLLLLCTIPVFALNNSPLSVPRFITGAYIIATMVVFFGLSRRMKFGLIPIITALQLTLFPYLAHITRGRKGTTFSLDPTNYLVSSGDFDGFQSVANVVAMVHDQGLMWGRNLASCLLIFVPRDLIPWKSKGTGVDAAEHLNYPFVNLSAPMPAELFVDFGYVGLVAFTLLLGILVARLDGRYEDTRLRGDVVGVVPIAVFAGFSMILFRGSLVGIIGTVGVTTLVAWASLLFLRTRSNARTVGFGTQ